ncbi:MAG: amidase family protein [Pseudomonadota bacterium]
MQSDWTEKGAAELGRGIAGGQIDPVELTQAFLNAAAANSQSDVIYARLMPERALAEADAARTRSKQGLRRGPLDGVPISWKDLFDTAGVKTEAGSELLAGRTPETDAVVLQRATQNGLICLGKTHLSELAFSGLGLNPVTATPPCVNDHGAVSGGSSSGAAASVAFGLAAGAIGSDTGGSVRIPAAWNDLVGLKTTHARLSTAGAVPLCRKFDTVGPLARTVEDAALLFAVMGGGAADLGSATLDGTSFLVLTTAAFDDIRTEPLEAFERSVSQLSAAGAKITRDAVPEVSQALDLSGTLYSAEAYGEWRTVIEAKPDLMFPEILQRFRGGKDVSAPDYVAAWHDLYKYRGAYAHATASYSAVLVPTSPILPPNRERLLSDEAYYKSENLMALRNTRIGNLMNLAVLTLPTGSPSCGISLMGPPGSEERLLRIGVAAERVLA